MWTGCWVVVVVVGAGVVCDVVVVLVRYGVVCGGAVVGGWDVLVCGVALVAIGVCSGVVGGSVGDVVSLVLWSGDVRVSVGSVWVGNVLRR